MNRKIIRLRAVLVLLCCVIPPRPPAAQTCQTGTDTALCAVIDGLWPRSGGARSDSLTVFSQIDLSQAQRMVSTHLKWSLRDAEEQAGVYLMAKRGVIQSPRPAGAKFSTTSPSHLDRNTLNEMIIGWEQVDARRYMAVSIGRQWSVRTNASQTLLYGKSQAPILSASFIDRWQNGWMLTAQTDVDALLRGMFLKASVQRELSPAIMLGPELSLYQDKSFQRQRLGAVVSGLEMMGTDYALSLGVETDSLSHRGAFSTLTASRRF